MLKAMDTRSRLLLTGNFSGLTMKHSECLLTSDSSHAARLYIPPELYA